MNIKFLRPTVFAFVALCLVGCNTPEQEPVEGSLSGTAPAGALITVYDADGAVVATGSADGGGDFTIDTDAYEPQLFYVEARSGAQNIETSTSVAIADNQNYTAMVAYAPRANNHVVVDGPTTVAVAYAGYLAQSEDAVTAYRKAYDAVSSWLGWDIEKFTVNRDLASYPGQQSDALKAHLFNGAVVAWCALMAERYGAAAGACNLSNVYRLAAKDIAHDGVIDGKILAGDLELAGKPFTGEVFKKDIPLQILKAAGDSGYAYDRAAANAYAESLIGTTTTLVDFNSVAVDKSKPYIDVVGLNDIVNGTHTLYYDVFDYFGVKYLSAFVDGTEIELQPKSGILEIDTRKYNNGSLAVEFQATSSVGVVSTVSGTLTVQNRYEVIAGLVAGTESVEAGEVNLQAVVSLDQGVQEVRLSVDSTLLVAFGSKSASSDLALYEYVLNTESIADGAHIFMVEVVTALGNTYSESMEFVSKNSGPEIIWSLPAKDENATPDVPVFSKIENINFTVTDEMPVERIEVYWGDSLIYNYLAGGETGAENYQYDIGITVDTRTLYEARHVIKVKAIGVSGVSSTQEREVMVDWSDPSIRILSPNGIVLRGPGPHYLPYTASDTNAVDDDTFVLAAEHPDLAGWTDIVGNDFDSNTGEGLIELNPPLWDDGNRTIKMQVSDIAGKTTHAEIAVVYGNRPPEITGKSLVERNSGDLKKGIFTFSIRDMYAEREPRVSDFVVTPELTTHIDTVTVVTPRDGEGVFTFSINEYDTGTSSCDGIGKSASKEHVKTNIVYNSTSGNAITIVLISDVAGDNFAAGIVKVDREYDCN